MNVKPGDLARVVGTGTVNDGAVVRVKARDLMSEFWCGEPHWFVSGEKLLGFRGSQPFPSVVTDQASCMDRRLVRIEPDEPALDQREDLEVDQPTTPTEIPCLTT